MTVPLPIRVQCVTVRTIPEAVRVPQVTLLVLDIILLTLHKGLQACDSLLWVAAQIDAHAADTACNQRALEKRLEPGKRRLVDGYRDAGKEELGRRLVESPACETRGFDGLDVSAVIVAMPAAPVESVLTAVPGDGAVEV